VGCFSCYPGVMQLSSLNGTRFGTFVQTILFLTGVPSIIDHSRDREVSTKQGGRSGLNLDTLSPNPHPDGNQSITQRSKSAQLIDSKTSILL